MRIFITFFILTLSSGCELTEAKIDIPYEGTANLAVVAGAENISFSYHIKTKGCVLDCWNKKEWLWNGDGEDCVINDVSKHLRRS